MNGDGKQDILLDKDCWNVNTVVHELLHTVGFGHEHQRPDRERYVTILWEKIDKTRTICISFSAIGAIHD